MKFKRYLYKNILHYAFGDMLKIYLQFSNDLIFHQNKTKKITRASEMVGKGEPKPRDTILQKDQSYCPTMQKTVRPDINKHDPLFNTFLM
jgi:hypothetical protein